jgi:NTP pyrophosphatase (non-canonical NTP hydrolase)
MNKEQFKEVTQWQDSIFTKATPLSCANHLQEEIIELKEKAEHGIIDKKEIADCFLLLFGFCNKAGLTYDDIVNLIDDKMEINYVRKWGQVNQKGYVKHIE